MLSLDRLKTSDRYNSCLFHCVKKTDYLSVSFNFPPALYSTLLRLEFVM